MALHRHEIEGFAKDPGEPGRVGTRFGYGVAYGAVDEYEDGTLWIDNGEYGAPVNFCPVCGVAARTPWEFTLKETTE